MRGKIPLQQGGDCPFCKSQLDSQMFGVVGPTRLCIHYHSKIFKLVALKLKKRERLIWYPILKVLEIKFKYNII